MKNILVTVLLASLGSISAQNKGPGSSGEIADTFESFKTDRNDLGRAREIKRSGKAIDGTKYIWKEWNNEGLVEASNGKKYKVSNINFNAKNNWFEVNVHKDSSYAFNRRKIHKVHINDKVFINVQFPEAQRDFVVQEIAKSENFTIVKKYDIEIIYGSHDPMRGSTRDKYKLLYDYYIKEGESLEKLKLKKSAITKLYGENGKKVAAYAKKEKLSFKDDAELAKIIAYANAL